MSIKSTASEVFVIIVSLLSIASCDHLIMGNVNNNRKLIYQTKVQNLEVPVNNHIKNMFYSGRSIIKSVLAYDNLLSKATAKVTAGGIGSTFINLRIRSERVVFGEHMIMGDINSNKQLIHHIKVDCNSIPFMKRTTNAFYSGHPVINSLIAYDNLFSKAIVTVTGGGIGYTYISLNIKNEQGRPLNYDICIYA